MAGCWIAPLAAAASYSAATIKNEYPDPDLDYWFGSTNEAWAIAAFLGAITTLIAFVLLIQGFAARDERRRITPKEITTPCDRRPRGAVGRVRAGLARWYRSTRPGTRALVHIALASATGLALPWLLYLLLGGPWLCEPSTVRGVMSEVDASAHWFLGTLFVIDMAALFASLGRDLVAPR